MASSKQAPVRVERSRDDGRTWRTVRRAWTTDEALNLIADLTGNPASRVAEGASPSGTVFRKEHPLHRAVEEGDSGAGDAWLRIVDERL